MKKNMATEIGAPIRHGHPGICQEDQEDLNALGIDILKQYARQLIDVPENGSTPEFIEEIKTRFIREMNDRLLDHLKSRDMVESDMQFLRITEPRVCTYGGAKRLDIKVTRIVRFPWPDNKPIAWIPDDQPPNSV